jgi:hypothetical protein
MGDFEMGNFEIRLALDSWRKSRYHSRCQNRLVTGRVVGYSEVTARKAAGRVNF